MQSELDKQLLDLKEQITIIGMSIPGSIHTMYLRCGKENCRCHESDEHRHGPYYLWYRRINGKLTTKSIAEEDLHLYRLWIRNRDQLETVVQKMLELGASYASNFKKTTPGKIKKSAARTRGK